MDLCWIQVGCCLSCLKRPLEAFGWPPSSYGPQYPSFWKARLWRTCSTPRLTRAGQPGVLVESEPEATLAACPGSVSAALSAPCLHFCWVFSLPGASPAVTFQGQISSLPNNIEAVPVISNRPHHAKIKYFWAGTPQLYIVGHRPNPFLVPGPEPYLSHPESRGWGQ